MIGVARGRCGSMRGAASRNRGRCPGHPAWPWSVRLVRGGYSTVARRGHRLQENGPEPIDPEGAARGREPDPGESRNSAENEQRSDSGLKSRETSRLSRGYRGFFALKGRERKAQGAALGPAIDPK